MWWNGRMRNPAAKGIRSLAITRFSFRCWRRFLSSVRPDGRRGAGHVLVMDGPAAVPESRASHVHCRLLAAGMVDEAPDAQQGASVDDSAVHWTGRNAGSACVAVSVEVRPVIVGGDAVTCAGAIPGAIVVDGTCG